MSLSSPTTTNRSSYRGFAWHCAVPEISPCGRKRQDGARILAAAKKAVPDFLILSPWKGGNDRIELLQRILKQWPSIRMLIDSMNTERSGGARTLFAGAARIFLIHSSP